MQIASNSCKQARGDAYHLPLDKQRKRERWEGDGSGGEGRERVVRGERKETGRKQRRGNVKREGKKVKK